MSTLHFNNAGIDPDNSSEHKTYLDQMCSDFVDSMTKMVDESVNKSKIAEDPLIDECCQHIKFCQSKYEDFHGREEMLAVSQTCIVISISSRPLYNNMP